MRAALASLGRLSVVAAAIILGMLLGAFVMLIAISVLGGR